MEGFEGLLSVMALDDDGNLWFGNGHRLRPLAVRRKTYGAFDVGGDRARDRKALSDAGADEDEGDE